MKKAGIIGFGRFGALLAGVCQPVFEVYIVESNLDCADKARASGFSVIAFEELTNMDFIFLAVPIFQTESVIQQLAPLVQENQVIADVCSVKVYPVNLMKKYLGKAQIIGTHPLFGPDSAKIGLKSLPVAFCPVSIAPENELLLRQMWESQGVIVVDTTPEKHDKDAVYSMAFTYSIASIILNMDFPVIAFTTRSYNAIREIATISANDSEQLFHDMLFYNPFYAAMKAELDVSIAKTKNRLEAIAAEQVSTGLL